MKKILIILCLFSLVLMASCTEAETVSYNISQDADSFRVLRKITFINTVDGNVLYTVEGNISITADHADNQLEITAKIGENEYQKHFLGLSPTTVYIVEQLEWNEVNQYQFKVVIRPSALIPEVEVQ